LGFFGRVFLGGFFNANPAYRTLSDLRSFLSSVADPNPDPDRQDPYVFGPSGSGSGSIPHMNGSGSFYH
jgi:hypothetical protein